MTDVGDRLSASTITPVGYYNQDDDRPWSRRVHRVTDRATVLAVNALVCPHCGEPLETYPDPGGGSTQDYVEDCAVCCRPIRFLAVYDEAEGEYRIDVSAEP